MMMDTMVGSQSTCAKGWVVAVVALKAAAVASVITTDPWYVIYLATSHDHVYDKRVMIKRM